MYSTYSMTSQHFDFERNSVRILEKETKTSYPLLQYLHRVFKMKYSILILLDFLLLQHKIY